MSVFSDYLPPGDFDDAAEWFKGEGGKVENERMPEHKHWCDGCYSWWGHEEPCEYGMESTWRGADWPCPMCQERGVGDE